MLKIYAGHIRKFNIGGILPERLYAVVRVDLYGNTLAPFYEGFTTGRVFLHNDWCEIRKQHDGRWEVHPLSAELAALLRANGVGGLPSADELEPADGNDGGWYPGYGGGDKGGDGDEDKNGGDRGLAPAYDPELGTGETPQDPVPSWHHCSVEKYFPAGLPKNMVIDPDWEPSTKTAEYTFGATCPSDPNFPSLVYDFPKITGWAYTPPDGYSTVPTEECPTGMGWVSGYEIAVTGGLIGSFTELACVVGYMELLHVRDDVKWSSDGTSLYAEYYNPANNSNVYYGFYVSPI